MKFGDKFKDLRKQAQDAVAENREKIHDAVDVVSTTVDQKTGGKHTAKIAKFGEQAGAAVDRFSEGEGESESDGAAGDGPTAGAGSSPGAPSPQPTSRPSTGSAPPAAPAAGEPYGGTPPAFDE